MNWRTTVSQDDVASIRNMVIAAGVFSQEEIDVAEELAQDAATLGEKSHYNFLMAQGARGGVAAYTCFGRIPLTDERYDLYWIVTDPTQQRQGLARELMTRTEDAIRKLGGKAIYAETSSRDIYLPAQKFYLRTGFELAARVKDFYREGDDKLLYCKWL